MENQNAVTYDYKTVRVKRETETMLTDAYKNLGYEVTGINMAEGSLKSVNVSFKRDRKISNKPALISLQGKIDTSVAKIENLIAKKNSAGVPEAISMGVVGSLVLGGGMSMCMLLTGAGYMIGGIVIGVAGIALGLLGWLVHNKIQKKKLVKIEPELEAEYDRLSELCEQANSLLQ